MLCATVLWALESGHWTLHDTTWVLGVNLNLRFDHLHFENILARNFHHENMAHWECNPTLPQALELWVWAPELWVWTLVSGLWALDSGLWALVSGLWALVSGLWALVSLISSLSLSLCQG